MATFVLIHGAWHGGWCWYKVVCALERLGHTAIAPDLPGHGVCCNRGGLPTLRDYVASVLETVERCEIPPILVGHSMAGAVISAAGEQAPAKIAKLVYVSAVLCRSGQSVNDAASVQASEVLPKYIIPAADGSSILFDPAGLRQSFYHDCHEEDVVLAKLLLTPQAIEPLTCPVLTTNARFGQIPRFYMACSRDAVLPIAVQREMVKAMPCTDVMTFESSHSPFFSMPGRLAEALDRTAQT